MSSKRFRGKPAKTPLEKARRTALATYEVPGSASGHGLEYVLQPDRIEIWQGGQTISTVPLHTVRKVQLGFDPGAPGDFYTCTIQAAGYHLVLRYNSTNLNPDGSFSHFGKSALYEQFVRRLLGQLADYPHARFQAGSGILSIVFAVVAPVFLGVAWLGFMGREIVLTLAGLEIAAAAGGMLLGLRLRRFDPRNPPEKALPSWKIREPPAGESA